MRLGIDIDGCLANFTKAFGQALIEHVGENKLPENWQTDPNFPATWNWHLDAGYTREQADRVWREVVEAKGFWYGLEPFEDTKDTLKQLNRLSKQGHSVYFLTHRSGKLAKRQTEDWLMDHGMELPTVLLTGDKLPILLGLGLEFFIDDKLATVNEIQRYLNQRAGLLPQPVVLLKDAPYNQRARELGVRSVPSVEAGLREIELWQEPKRGRPRLIQEAA